MNDSSFGVDWTRRRIMPLGTNLTHCLHHSRLTEWCPSCEVELDEIAADMHGSE